MKIYFRETAGQKAVLEVIGQSGAGKSYLIRTVARDLQLSQLEFPGAGFQPYSMLRALYRGLLTVGHGRDRYRIAKNLYSRTRRADAIASMADGVFLVDEGMLHLARKCFGSRPPEEIVGVANDVLSMSSYRPTTVFALHASPEILHARRYHRSRKGERCDMQGIIRTSDLYRHHLRHIQSIAAAIGCEFVELDVSTDEAAERARRIVHTRIEQYLGRAAEASAESSSSWFRPSLQVDPHGSA